MDENDQELSILRRRLELLQRQKQKHKRHKVKSNRPRGRPCIDPKRIEMARDLAREQPIPLVALKTGLALSTLYRYGIKRKILNNEKAQMSEK